MPRDTHDGRENGVDGIFFRTRGERDVIFLQSQRLDGRGATRYVSLMLCDVLRSKTPRSIRESRTGIVPSRG